jgi:hypothetical protein
LHRARIASLLDRVRKFMREQLAPLMSRGRKFVCSENYVLTHGIRVRMYRARGGSRSCVGMHTDICEVVTEVRLHECARCRIELLPGAIQHFMNDRRNFGKLIVL